MSPELHPYLSVKFEQFCIKNLAFRADNVTIPTSMCDRLVRIDVELAHKRNSGIVKTKQQRREIYCWSGWNSQVERTVRNCIVCQTANKSAKPVLHPSRLSRGYTNRGKSLEWTLWVHSNVLLTTVGLQLH